MRNGARMSAIASAGRGRACAAPWAGRWPRTDPPSIPPIVAEGRDNGRYPEVHVTNRPVSSRPRPSDRPTRRLRLVRGKPPAHARRGVSHAGPAVRRRGCRAGGVAAVVGGVASRRPRPGCLPRHDDLAARARPPPPGRGAPGSVRRRMATRACRHRRRPDRGGRRRGDRLVRPAGRPQTLAPGAGGSTSRARRSATRTRKSPRCSTGPSPAIRQAASRARTHVSERSPRFSPDKVTALEVVFNEELPRPSPLRSFTDAYEPARLADPLRGDVFATCSRPSRWSRDRRAGVVHPGRWSRRGLPPSAPRSPRASRRWSSSADRASAPWSSRGSWVSAAGGSCRSSTTSSGRGGCASTSPRPGSARPRRSCSRRWSRGLPGCRGTPRTRCAPSRIASTCCSSTGRRRSTPG